MSPKSQNLHPWKQSQNNDVHLLRGINSTHGSCHVCSKWWEWEEESLWAFFLWHEAHTLDQPLWQEQWLFDNGVIVRLLEGFSDIYVLRNIWGQCRAIPIRPTTESVNNKEGGGSIHNLPSSEDSEEDKTLQTEHLWPLRMEESGAEDGEQGWSTKKKKDQHWPKFLISKWNRVEGQVYLELTTSWTEEWSEVNKGAAPRSLLACSQCSKEFADHGLLEEHEPTWR